MVKVKFLWNAQEINSKWSDLKIEKLTRKNIKRKKFEYQSYLTKHVVNI